MSVRRQAKSARWNSIIVTTERSTPSVFRRFPQSRSVQLHHPPTSDGLARADALRERANRVALRNKIFGITRARPTLPRYTLDQCIPASIYLALGVEMRALKKTLEFPAANR